MGQMTISIIFAANTLIRAAHFNTVHVTDIRDTYNVHDTATTGVHGLSGGADFVGTTTSQTLTNKTLTAPVLGGTVTGTYTLGGTPTITAPILSGSITGTYTLAGTPTITAPTISSPVLSGSVTGTYTLAGSPTITAPAINSPVLGGTVTGTYTLAGTPTLSGTVAGTPTFSGLVTFSTAPLLPATDPPAANAATRQGIVKGWGTKDIVGGRSLTDRDFNVSSVTHNGTGDNTFTWDTDFLAGQAYAFGASCIDPDIMICFCEAINAAPVGSLRIKTRVGVSGLDDAASGVTVFAFGDQ